jgi:penicillin-insensitive murein DD-endopeptidase
MMLSYHFCTVLTKKKFCRAALSFAAIFCVGLSHGEPALGQKGESFEITNTEPTNWFAGKTTPTEGPPFSIGGYSAGCLAGGKALKANQRIRVMRPERSRYFGHPSTLALLERASSEAPTELPLLVGDISQARGGPMPFGHASHQIGLDVDIWFPNTRELKEKKDQKEMMSLLDSSRKRVDGAKWTEDFALLILWFARQPEVERIFVNAAIKQKLCSMHAKKAEIAKVRPWYFHDSHFHVRLKCPDQSPLCRGQSPSLVKECSAADFAPWFSEESLRIQKALPAKPIPRKVRLPQACLELR